MNNKNVKILIIENNYKKLYALKTGIKNLITDKNLDLNCYLQNLLS